MKKYILLFVLIAFSWQVNAQFSVTYSAGYGDYKMTNLKSLLNEIESGISSQYPNIPFKITDNFPGYINHNLDFSYRIKKHEFGIKNTYLTTGGKVAYSDYSGEYNGKLLLNAFRFGLSYRFYQPVAEFKNSGSLCLFGEISDAITFTNLKSKEVIRLFEETQHATDNIDSNSAGVSISPMLGLKWFVCPRIGLHISAGYDFQFDSKFKFQGQKTDLEADWSGFRTNAGLSIYFGK